MKTLFLEFASESKKSPSPTKAKHIWFDSATNTYHTFEGGKPQMEWNQNEKRFVPKQKWDKAKKKNVPDIQPINEMGWKKVDNSAFIQEWIRTHGRRFSVEVNREDSSNMGIAIEVEDNQLDDVVDSLYEHRIRYSEL